MKKNILHSFLFEGIHKGFTVVSAILIARILGPECKGQYALVTYVAAIVVSFVSVGLANAQIHLRRKYDLEKVTSNILFIALIIGILGISIEVIIIPFFLNSVFQGIDFHLILLIIFTIPIKVLSLSLKRVIQSKYDIRIYNYLKLIEPILFFVFLLASFLILTVSLKILIYTYLFACLLNFIITLIYVSLKVKIRIRFIDKSVLSDIIIYVLKVGPGGLLGFFQYRIDVFIIGYFLESYLVGLYVAGMAIAEIVWRIPAAVVNVLQPKLANSKDDEAKQITPLIFRQTFILVMLICMILGLFSKSILNLIYGSEFISAKYVLQIILPGVLFISMWKILLNDLNARGFPQYYSISALVGVFVMVVLDVALINSLGIEGAAIASTLAYFVSFISITYFYLTNTNQSIVILLPRRNDIIMLFKR